MKLRLLIIAVILFTSFTEAQYQLEDAFPNLPNFTARWIFKMLVIIQTVSLL